MPRILEMKEIDGAVWARLQIDTTKDEGSVYIWTIDEAKRDRASAIRSFCFDLANQYIEREHLP